MLLALLPVGCTDDISVDNESLTAQFSFDKLSYLTNEEVVIVNTTQGGSGAYSYEWDFGDGRTSTEAEPKISFAEIGAYKITLNVHDSKGRYAMAHKLLNIEPEPLPEVGNMTIKWIADQPLSTIRSISPAVSDDNFVYMTSEDHKARKFDGATGHQLWEFDMWTGSDGPEPAGNTHVTPSIDTDGTVYFGTGNTSGKIARLYALNPDGTKKWVMSSDANTGFWNKGNAATPRLHYIICPVGDDFVYVGNAGGAGSVLAVDKTTGYRAGYAASSPNDGGPNGGATGGLVISGNTIAWYGAKNGVFGCSVSELNGGGNVQYWLTPNNNTSDTGNGALAVGADGTIYGCAKLTKGSPASSCVFAISPAGSELWRCDIGLTGSLDVGGPVIAEDGSIIVTTKRTAGESNGGVYCVSPTGELRWSYGIAENVSGCAAIDQAGNIHFGTESGNYYIIKPTPGEDQLVLKKDLAAMIAESDSPMASSWTAGGGKIWSSPTIGSDGTVYIGITNNDNANASALVALKDEGITGPANSAWPMRGKDARHTSRTTGSWGGGDDENDPSTS
ncbi:MAG: PQQ-binding-like beta-propeller repeat protein, partial [Muribaculaceae bacterium]|nr:PQQ-binding-like beta-propeller repeat protein [Muribaculaceae bacterium]